MCKRPLLKVSSLSFPVFCLCLANTSPRSIEQKAIKTHHSHTWMLTGASNLSASQGHICHFQNLYLKSCRVKLQRKPHNVSYKFVVWDCAVFMAVLSRMCPTDYGWDISASMSYILGQSLPGLCTWESPSSALPCFPHSVFFHLLLPYPTFSKSWSLGAQELLYDFSPSWYSYFISSSKSRQRLKNPNFELIKDKSSLRCSRELNPGFCNQGSKAKAALSRKGRAGNQPSPQRTPVSLSAPTDR